MLRGEDEVCNRLTSGVGVAQKSSLNVAVFVPLTFATDAGRRWRWWWRLNAAFSGPPAFLLLTQIAVTDAVVTRSGSILYDVIDDVTRTCRLIRVTWSLAKQSTTTKRTQNKRCENAWNWFRNLLLPLISPWRFCAFVNSFILTAFIYQRPVQY